MNGKLFLDCLFHNQQQDRHRFVKFVQGNEGIQVPAYSLAAPPYGYGARPKVYTVEDMPSHYEGVANYDQHARSHDGTINNVPYPAQLTADRSLPVALQSAEKQEFQPRSPVPRPNGGPQSIPRPNPAARVG